jgi:hypothetical protein
MNNAMDLPMVLMWCVGDASSKLRRKRRIEVKPRAFSVR